jgi:hypothetical protein
MKSGRTIRIRVSSQAANLPLDHESVIALYSFPEFLIS